MRSLSLLLLLSLASTCEAAAVFRCEDASGHVSFTQLGLPRRAGRRDRRGGQPAAGRQERHADGRDEDEKASIGRKTCRSR